ncbi:MAG: aminoacyl-tRNA hydrolase [Dehalococcoidales bacterium]|nr:aminoacyl-tRNA hydrolase [Dehalococcoidales bacterium]
MKLVVGLGNPGYLYARNRHNLGFMCVNDLAKTLNAKFDRKQGHARTGLGMVGTKKILMARPQTYMNASGESVKALLQKYDMKPSDLIVIHDDLDLPTAKLRLRLGGGSGGHNGIESIIRHLGTSLFYRARVGIGRPEAEEDEKEDTVISYVLDDFTRDEKKAIEAVMPDVSQAVITFFREGLAAAMNKFN